jgi:hypothetical protein
LLSFFCKEKVNKAFSSVLYALLCTLNDAFLIRGNADDAESSGVCMLVGTMLHRQSKQSVPHVLPNGWIEKARPQTCFFPRIWLLIARISLSAGSIATHQSHTNSEPILSSVSSTTDSPTIFFLDESLLGLYFSIQSQMETWFRSFDKDEDSF